MAGWVDPNYKPPVNPQIAKDAAAAAAAQRAEQNAASQQNQTQARLDQQAAQARADQQGAAASARSAADSAAKYGVRNALNPYDIGGGSSQQQETSAEIAQREGEARKTELAYSAKLQADAEARRIGQLSSLPSAGGGGGSSSGGGATGGGAPTASPEMAQANAFAAAKDKAGQTARASLTSLYDLMAGTGRAGSGGEAAAAGDIISSGASDLNDFTRDQYGADVERANQVADRNYAGDITKQGQALGQQASLMGLITARGLY